MKLLFSFLFIIFTPFPVNAADNIETIQVKDNIYVLVSPKGGNVAVSVGDDGAFLIDDQLAGRSEIVESAVKEIGNKDIKFILNTHYHFDHSGGNEYLGKKGAIIVAHDNVRQRLSTKQFITYFKREMLPMSNAGLPTVTISDNMTFHYNNDDIRFVHTPEAHTDGDTVAYFEKSNVIVAGDLVFNGFYPFIDVEHGGSIKGLIKGIDVLLGIATQETVVIPGHGDIMSKSELQSYRDMLAAISEKIESAIKAGKTFEQIIDEKPTQAFDDKIEDGIVPPDAFVKIVYESLNN